MSDKMPEVIFVGRVSGHGIWGEWVDGVTHKDNAKYTRADIHEKAVKERDALKAENERLRGGLEELRDGYLPELWVNIEGRKPDIEDMDFIFDFIDKALQGRKETK